VAFSPLLAPIVMPNWARKSPQVYPKICKGITYSPHCFAALFVNLAAIMPTVKISSIFFYSYYFNLEFSSVGGFWPTLWLPSVMD
jgi:hypothetical protein